MKAVVLREFGPPDRLVLEEVEEPGPAAPAAAEAPVETNEAGGEE